MESLANLIFAMYIAHEYSKKKQPDVQKCSMFEKTCKRPDSSVAVEPRNDIASVLGLNPDLNIFTSK